MTSVSGSPWRQAGVRCSENTGATQRTAAPDVARRDYCDACMSRPCRMYVFASENACLCTLYVFATVLPVIDQAWSEGELVMPDNDPG